MTWRGSTVSILAATVASLVLYDVVVMTQADREDTITEVVRDVTEGRPWIVLAFGFLLGHIFWGTATK